MEYRRLGHSGLQVSSLCLGTMALGEADETSFLYRLGCDEKSAFEIMNHAFDSGINFFDTADVYGQDGMVEKLIGRWIKQEQRRDNLVLATKCRFRMSPDANGAGASRYRIMRAVEDSLKRLQTDRIELYQIHMQDTATPEEETLRALDDLVHQGKILYIGASNYAAYRLCDSLWTSKTHNLHHFVSLQAQYNLVSRELEREHLSLCNKHGLGVLVFSPLAEGFLTGKYQKDMQAPKGTRLDVTKDRFANVMTEKNWKILESVRMIAKELEVTPAALSLAWLLHKPAVSSVIFGARTLEQLNANFLAASLKLSAEVMGRLDAASDFDLGYPYRFIKSVQKIW